ncbi:MAG TPA: 5-formyltetrahydrofolate cyclo-ligase, partial [Candidatus Binatia bacterium]|nr:5-formyltetrahydrofolate cyclo-ligase [Candidatus Binatia bacterium]
FPPAPLTRPPSAKEALRLQVWAALRDVARPDARFHWDFTQFVPDFEGSDLCAAAIRRHPLYRRASIVFVAPDNSLTKVRAQAMADGKRLLVATHAIARGFYLVEPGAVPESQIPFAATLDGLEQHGRLLDVEGVRALGSIDLLVTGISLVTEQGVRWGKGHGYFDLEWAIFRELGVAGGDTPVIAVGHDCQIVAAELQPSPVDTIADLIITPTQVIEVDQVFDKPEGILWDSVSPELMRQVASLQALYAARSDKAGAQGEAYEQG